LETAESFTDVVKGVEHQLGRFDPTVFRSLPGEPKEAERLIEAMAGHRRIDAVAAMLDRRMEELVGVVTP
jgi:hypothetical protein